MARELQPAMAERRSPDVVLVHVLVPAATAARSVMAADDQAHDSTLGTARHLTDSRI
jgi:hypothetical protein